MLAMKLSKNCQKILIEMLYYWNFVFATTVMISNTINLQLFKVFSRILTSLNLIIVMLFLSLSEFLCEIDSLTPQIIFDISVIPIAAVFIGFDYFSASGAELHYLEVWKGHMITSINFEMLEYTSMQFNLNELIEMFKDVSRVFVDCYEVFEKETSNVINPVWLSDSFLTNQLNNFVILNDQLLFTQQDDLHDLKKSLQLIYKKYVHEMDLFR